MNELELILTDIFKCSRTDLYLNASSIAFRDTQLTALEKMLKQRAKSKPIQYILGHTEFMGLRLITREGVLIPRPETEILVEAVMQEKLKIKNKTEYNILDMGTGSGCIAIALAKFLEDANIIAVDISQNALDTARQNAKLNQVEEKIKFLESDLFSHELFKTDIKFDIIVSNPPYVPTNEIGLFDTKVNSEPRVALDGGKDGLNLYRKISKEAGKFLRKNGLLFLELGYGQSSAIKEIFTKGWKIEKIIIDYQNIDRVCIIKKG